jgi:hypothetical protein
MTTIGIICEGVTGGEDEQVLRHLASRICPGARVMVRPLGKKPDLIAQCGQVAEALFYSGCDRVLIVWDIQPRWGRPDGVERDIADIQAVLTQSEFRRPCLYLVPIKAELEAWLLADGSALSSVLSRPAHKVRINDTKSVEDDLNPKKRLERIFKQHGHTYAPKYDAIKIVKNIPEKFGTLNKLNSFKKFGLSLTQPC